MSMFRLTPEEKEIANEVKKDRERFSDPEFFKALQEKYAEHLDRFKETGKIDFEAISTFPPRELEGCIVVEVEGNPTDNAIEFAAWLESYSTNQPMFGTKLKKSASYCQKCGVKIPPHMPYFGGRFKTDICCICMKDIGEEALRVYERFAKENPVFIENYHKQLMVRKL